MKRILSAVSTACLVFSACENLDFVESQDSAPKEEAIASGSSGPAPSGSEGVVFTADLDAQTKTYLEYEDEIYKLRWSEDDQIFVWDATTLMNGTPEYEFCSMLSGAGTSSAQFGGTMDADSYFAIYADSYWRPDNGVPRILLPTTQNMSRDGSFDDYTYPMVAVSDTRTFQFENICSVLKLNITGNEECLRTVTVYSKDGEPISGIAKVVFDAQDYPALEFSGTTESESVYTWVDVNCDDAFLSGTPYECYVVVPAQTYAQGLGITLVTDDGQYMDVSTATGITTKRSQLHEISIDFEDQVGPLPDGVYIIGDATGAVVPLNADPSLYKMFPDAAREGKYEKFLVLNSNGTTFSVVRWENGVKTVYGGSGIERRTLYDIYQYQWYGIAAGDDADYYLGVDSPGLYHIVLDLDQDATLGGPQLALLPADWKVRGTCNTWGATEMERTELMFQHAVYRLEDISFLSVGGKFKFEYTACEDWGLEPFPGQWVNANLGLNNGSLVIGGPDITIPDGSGIYDIELNWDIYSTESLTSGFTYSVTLEGSIDYVDYSNCPMELVGTSVYDGSPDQSGWGWGNVLASDGGGYPTLIGNMFVWTWSDVYLYDETYCLNNISGTPGFKVRTVGYQSYDGIAAWDAGYAYVDQNSSDYVTEYDTNIMVSESGYYDVVLTVDMETNVPSVKIVRQ